MSVSFWGRLPLPSFRERILGGISRRTVARGLNSPDIRYSARTAWWQWRRACEDLVIEEGLADASKTGS